MDAARGWQVISVVTAVAGLGAGSLLVGRSVSTEVAPIDLDTAPTAVELLRSVEDPLPSLAEIVAPAVREDRVSVSATAASSDDLASIDDLARPIEPDGPADSGDAASVASTASVVSVTSPDSVSSAS